MELEYITTEHQQSFGSRALAHKQTHIRHWVVRKSLFLSDRGTFVSGTGWWCLAPMSLGWLFSWEELPLVEISEPAGWFSECARSIWAPAEPTLLSVSPTRSGCLKGDRILLALVSLKGGADLACRRYSIYVYWKNIPYTYLWSPTSAWWNTLRILFKKQISQPCSNIWFIRSGIKVQEFVF